MDRSAAGVWVWRAVVALGLFLPWLAWPGAANGGEDPGRKLTPAERARLEKEVGELDRQVMALYRRGQYAEATALLERALGQYRKLYPEGEFPRGHTDLAQHLTILGFLLQVRGDLAGAERLYREALGMYRKLYPEKEFPRGHTDLADSLNQLGFLLQARGDLAGAERLYREGLGMRRKLYPEREFPRGHADLALSLHNLGSLLQDRGDLAGAERLCREALGMCRKLYPEREFPRGHPLLARNLNQLGFLLQARGDLAGAEQYYREALGMRRKLYPEKDFPRGHADLAISLNNLGGLLKVRGDLAGAEQYYREALGMKRKLYPEKDFPRGLADLAASLHNLGELLQARGDLAGAEPLLREALGMRRKFYPERVFPRGHADLAGSLNNLGELLKARGDLAGAEPLLREALGMCRKLYPEREFPRGHPHLAASLNNLGVLLDARGDLAGAEPLHREALGMRRKLYPEGEFPRGHPDLAHSLHNLGELLQARGDLAGAEPLLRQALAMFRKHYPEREFPRGHRELATSLNNLGALLWARGDLAGASEAVGQGLAMDQGLAEFFADTEAEAEALNYLATFPAIREVFLDVTARLPNADTAAHYRVLWQGKAALARVLQRRGRLLQAATDRATRQKVERLLDARRRLARLMLAPATGKDGDRSRALRELTGLKEELEKGLARQIPEVAREQARQTRPYTDLADRLPAQSAFVDLFRYGIYDPKRKRWDGARYAAFVVRQGRPVRRADLGDAAAVEKALAAWRRDIAAGQDGVAGERLRRLVWEPLARLLPADTQTVYLCPDGELGALPWAALPGRKPGTVLLEDHAVALVPSGPFLLEQLSERAKPARAAGTLLAVGGVRYDRDPDPADRPADVAFRPARRGADSGPWQDLPGTAREVDRVAGLARTLPRPPEVVVRRGSAAGVNRVLLDLPRARWAHLATHGFFAAPDSDTRAHLYRLGDFLLGVTGERRGAAARNPLTQTGLVLAGANRPPRGPEADGGILTAEALAGMDLGGLDLAVLSACETGLGEAQAGEGVFGLQRAFHLAGTRDVVASLWRVDDQATAALMALFYHHLWVKEEPPIQALRHAQLDLYRHPGDVAVLAQGRGPNFDKVVRRLTRPPDRAAERTAGRRAPVRHWAAFVLSGAGR